MRALALAAAIVAMVALPSVAHLIDPNNPGGPCYYPPGSMVCQPIPPQTQPSQRTVPLPPVSSGGNSCEAQCRITQQTCMQNCPQQGRDFYRCFAQCGEVNTLCMRKC